MDREHTTVRLTADGRHVLGMYYSAHRSATSHIALRVTSVHVVIAHEGILILTFVLTTLRGTKFTLRIVSWKRIRGIIVHCMMLSI